MKTLNYQKRFVEQVKDGSKRQTLRKRRKDPFVVGDELRHFTGQRTKNCRKLLDSVCTKARAVEIAEDGVVKIDGVLLSVPEAHELAKADGFGRYGALLAWIDKTHGLPFKGQVINW